MDESVTKIHVTKVLSSAMIVDLIDKYPNLSEITCSPSVYNRTSKNYIGALQQLDIEVNKEYNWGAKSRTNCIEKTVLNLAKKGLTAREISRKLDININRVYYLLRKNKEDIRFDNYKRKNNHSEVRILKDEGFSAKEISQKLDIPLRSVYYILNKK